jgi:hypothetical protein
LNTVHGFRETDLRNAVGKRISQTKHKMDRQTVYSLDLWGEQKSEASAGQESNNQVQKKLVDFILSFAVDNAFIYRYVTVDLWLWCET